MKIIIKENLSPEGCPLFPNHKTASLSMWEGKEANMTTKSKVMRDCKAFIEIGSFGSVSRNTGIRSRINTVLAMKKDAYLHSEWKGRITLL